MGRKEERRDATLADHGRHFLRHRVIKPLAESFGFVTYEPAYNDYKPQLEAQTTYVESEQHLRDNRASVYDNKEAVDLTLTTDGLADVFSQADLEGLRILEVGPKHGIHSLWIDENLKPSELVFCDFRQDSVYHDKWKEKIKCRNRWVFGDIRFNAELLSLQKFDIVLFLGVLYHSYHHTDLLATLNRITVPSGKMLLETTYDSRPDASTRVRWGGTLRAKAMPTIDALRLMLAWTGWRKVTRYVRYRPDSSEALFLCEKTDEIPPGRDFCDAVIHHKE